MIDPCFLDVQYTGALFKNTMNPVLDLLVFSLPAWSESTQARILNPNPRGLGALVGRDYLASAYTE